MPLTKNIFKSCLYYILLLVGLVTTSWIIWARFIRTRTIRDIPDYLLTEYRFWILLDICLIYVLIIKSLIKPSATNLPIKEILDFIYKPLTTLDHTIKYNHYVKPYYYKIMIKFMIFADYISDFHITLFVFFMQIFPRFILVAVLLLDTFYFERIEIFYKVVLIGILPFIFRFIKYSFKDIYEHWIITLEEKYESVLVYEEGYRFDKSRIGNTEAEFHMQEKSIREYIQIKYENLLTWLGNYIFYEYESSPYPHSEIQAKYMLDKYNNTKKRPDIEDIDKLDELYYELMPRIIDLKVFIARYELVVSEKKIIKWSKIFIFTMYLICWAYILFISYGFYPVELTMAKNLLLGLIRRLSEYQDPFSGIIDYFHDT